MSTTWDQVRRAVADGTDPTISVCYAMLRIPERPPRRRKVAPEPSDLEKQARRLLGVRVRPRCLNPHCRIRLRRRQAWVCNEDCRRAAIGAYQAVADLLGGAELPAEVKEVPDVWDPLVARGLPRARRRA